MPEIKTQIPFRVVDRKMFKGLGGGGGDTPPDGSDPDKILKYLHAKSEKQTQALKEGRYQEALKGYAEIISLVKKHGLKLSPETKKNISNNIGYGWYQLGRYEKSGKRFKTNLSQDDKDLVAKNGYAACLVMQAKQKPEENKKNLGEAEILLTEIIQQIKEDENIPSQVQAVIENNLGCTQYLLKQPEKAQDTFLLASQDDPQNQLIWANRAIYFIKTDKLEDAKWATEKSAEIDQQKTDTSLNYNTATILLTKKKPATSQLKGVLEKVMERKSRQETQKIKAATQPTRLKVVEEKTGVKEDSRKTKKEKIQQMMGKPVKIVNEDIAVESFEKQGMNAVDTMVEGGQAESMQTTLSAATANQRLEYMLGVLKQIKQKKPGDTQKNNIKKHLFEGLNVKDEQNHTDQNILLWTAEILKIIGNKEDARKLWSAHQNLDPHYKSDEVILESIKSVEQGMNV